MAFADLRSTQPLRARRAGKPVNALLPTESRIQAMKVTSRNESSRSPVSMTSADYVRDAIAGAKDFVKLDPTLTMEKAAVSLLVAWCGAGSEARFAFRTRSRNQAELETLVRPRVRKELKG